MKSNSAIIPSLRIPISVSCSSANAHFQRIFSNLRPSFTAEAEPQHRRPHFPFPPQICSRLWEWKLHILCLRLCLHLTFTQLQRKSSQSTPTAPFPDRRVTVRGNYDMLFAKHGLRVQHTVASRHSRPTAYKVFDEKSQPEL
ncbi:hypothetical protein SDJN03_11220, partial [Cucurbita argyrosperma subsp. sororia]